MDTQQPSFDEWRKLYAAAAAFKEAAPWEWMFEDDLFGVRDPESGQIGYGSIMGALGEHLALALYPGSEGLEGFWRIHTDAEADPAIILEIPQLQASWEDREELQDKDREVIKSLGLKFRGRQAWPLFRAYVPGYLPWFVSDAEARFLTVALEQGLEVALRVRDNPNLLDPLYDGIYLVRTAEAREGALVWRDEWLEPEPFEEQPLAITIEPAELAALRRLPFLKMTLQADLFPFPGGIQEKGDPRPYFAYMLMLVDADSGFILRTDLMAPKPTLKAVWQQTPQNFLKALQPLRGLPARVHVRSERLWNLLEPLTAELGIHLDMARSLPALEEARAFLEQRIF
ncbi:MAG: hypothetical protein QHJ81_13185 [Anaerolineae bacterium]|nr:hypothetical protein [Anaerolineae bacterium]